MAKGLDPDFKKDEKRVRRQEHERHETGTKEPSCIQFPFDVLKVREALLHDIEEEESEEEEVEVEEDGGEEGGSEGRRGSGVSGIPC